MSLYAVAQDGQQSQARALTPASCAGGSVWPLSAQHAATCTGRGSARAAPSSCAAPHHCISLLPFSSRTGKEEGAAPSRSQKGTAAAKEGGWWWWGFGNSTAGGVRQPTATLPTDAEQTAKLHRGWDGALLPPCWSCHTMPPSLPQQQCNWAPPASPHCHRAGSGALQAAAGGQRAHGRRNRRHNVPTGTQTFYFLPAVLSRQRRTTTKHQEGTTEEETTRATHAKHRDTLTVRNTAAQSLDPSTAPRTPSSTHSPPLGAPLPCIQSAMPAGPGALQQPGAVLCAAAAFLQHRGCAHLWAVPCSEGYGHRLALSPHGRAVAVPPGCAGSLARARSTLSRCLGCRKALWCIPRDNLGGRGCGVRGFHTALPSTQ